MTVRFTQLTDITDKPGDIRVGSRFYLEKGDLYEVVRMPERGHSSVLLRKVHGSATKRRGLSILKHMIDQGYVMPARPSVTLDELKFSAVQLSPKDRFAFEHRVAVVKALNALRPGTPKSVARDEIKRATEKHNRKAESYGTDTLPPPHYATARRWLRIFLEAQIYTSLAWQNHRKKERPKQIDARDSRLYPLMDEVINEFYADSMEPTVTKGYDEFVTQCHEQLFPELTFEQLRQRVPSRSTFYRRLYDADHLTIAQKRVGKREAEKQHTHGGAVEIPNVIGGLVEIDCTQVDVFVKHPDFNFRYRPWVMVFIDVLTRCIIAWDFSLAPPSGFKAARTLQKAVGDDGYPYRTLVMRFVGDHGPEFANQTFIRMGTSIGADMDFANPDHPNGKPHIESFFNSSNERFFHHMAGTTRGKQPRDRTGHPEKEAVYTLETLEMRFREFLDIYHHQVHSRLGITPHQKWIEAMQDPLRGPRTLSLEDAQFLGMTIEHRQINKGRIQAHKLWWTAPSLTLLDKRLRSKNRMAEVRVNPFDLGHVYVCDPRNTNALIKCDPINPRYQHGLPLEDHLAISQDLREWNRIHNNDAELAIRRANFYRTLRNDAEDGLLDELRRTSTRTASGTQKAARKIAAASSHAQRTKPAQQPQLPDVGDLEDYLG